MKNQPKIINYGINYGLVLGLISITFAVMLFFQDAHYSQSIYHTLIGIALMIGVSFWAISQFRKANQGYLSIGQAIKIAIGISVFSFIVFSVYQFILVTYLDPEFIEKSMRIQLEEPLADGTMNAEQVETKIEYTKKFYWVGSVVLLFINLLMGLVIGLIGGLIFRKNTRENEE